VNHILLPFVRSHPAIAENIGCLRCQLYWIPVPTPYVAHYDPHHSTAGSNWREAFSGLHQRRLHVLRRTSRGWQQLRPYALALRRLYRYQSRFQHNSAYFVETSVCVAGFHGSQSNCSYHFFALLHPIAPVESIDFQPLHDRWSCRSTDWIGWLSLFELCSKDVPQVFSLLPPWASV
jgi:hypothetical protein